MPARMLALSLVFTLTQGVVAPAAAGEGGNGLTVIEEALDIDDQRLRLRVRLPEDWRHALEFGHTLTLYSQAGGGRALSITGDPNETLLALGVPEFPLFAEGTRVESWAGEFAGHPARFFRGRGNERNQVMGLGRALEGTRLVVRLDSCVGRYERPVVIVAQGGAAFDSLQSDPYLGPLAAMVALQLPEDVQPCPDDLDAGLRAVAIDPPEGEGWVRREAAGLAVTLPERFDWQRYPDDAGFAAQDRGLPGDSFMSVFTDRIERADSWRDELPADARISALMIEDAALADRFEAHRVAFVSDDGEGHAIVMVTRQQGSDGRHMALVMLSLGQPAATAVPRLEAILSRLAVAG